MKLSTVLFYLVVITFTLNSCNQRAEEIKEEVINWDTTKISYPYYMASSEAMGIKSTFNFLSSGDAMLLYYYSIRADSFYVYDVTNKASLLSSHPFNVEDSTKAIVRGITPISTDSIFILCDADIYLYDLQRGKAVFHKRIPEEYSLLSHFTTPVYNKKENAFYTELIQWNVPKSKNGVFNSKMLAKINLKTGFTKFLDLKVNEEMTLKAIQYYFSPFKDRLYYGYSHSDSIYVSDKNKLNFKSMPAKTPIGLDNNISSQKPERIDRMREENTYNTYFGELFSNKEHLYRIQYLPLPGRNEEGLVPGLSEKSFVILEYDEDLNLKRVLKPEPKIFLLAYFSFHQDQLYALSHSPGSITIYRLKF